MLPFLGYVLASFLVMGHHVFPLDQISESTYSREDAYICLWGLWWTKHAIVQGLNPYFTPMLFYPMGTSLAFHAYPLTYGLLSLPFQWLIEDVSGLVVTFNSIIFLSFVFSGFGAYLLTTHVTGSRLAGWIGGIIFAFIPFHSLNRVSLHLLAIEFIPFYILCLLRLSERPTLRRGILTGLCFALAYYSSLEYALSLFLFSCLWLLYNLIFTRQISQKLVRALTLSCAAFLLLASPLALQQFRAYSNYHSAIEQDFDEITFWSPALLSYVIPSRMHPYYGQALASAGELTNQPPLKWGMRSETSIGWVAMILAIIGVRGFRNRNRAFWLLAALFFFSLSLGPFLRVTGEWLSEIPLPFFIYYKWVHLFRAGRDPTRFIPFAMLMLSMIAGFGLCSIVRSLKGRTLRFLIATLVSQMILFESLIVWVGSYQPSVPEFYRHFAGPKNGVAIIDLTSEPFKLLPQTVHEKSITWLDKTIPRTPSKSWMLPVEYDLRHPGEFFQLDAPAQSQRLEEHKESLKNLKIKVIVSDRDPAASLKIRLAEQLGADMAQTGEFLIFRLP